MKIRSLVCIITVCFAGLLISFKAKGVDEGSDTGSSNALIQVYGELVWRKLTNGLSSGSNRVTQFSVVLDGCKYKMNEKAHPTAASQSLYCDETNWYNELVLPPNFMASNITRFTIAGPVTIPAEKPFKPNPSLTVSPIIEPILPRITPLLPVWLAFGSGCHFNRENAREIPSMIVMAPGPLSQVVLLKADRVLRQDGGLERYTDYWDAQPTGTALTNIAFQVTAWTNIGAVIIPGTFRFTRYHYSPDGKPQYYLSMDGTGHVTKVERLVGSVAFGPKIATNTYVVHFSSHTWEPVSYIAKDARLKPQDEVDTMRR